MSELNNMIAADQEENLDDNCVGWESTVDWERVRNDLEEKVFSSIEEVLLTFPELNYSVNAVWEINTRGVSIHTKSMKMSLTYVHRLYHNTEDQDSGYVFRVAGKTLSESSKDFLLFLNNSDIVSNMGLETYVKSHRKESKDLLVGINNVLVL